MDDIAGALRALHITAGSMALFVAPGAMLARKGGVWHRRWGKVYFWAMAAVAATAVALSVIRPSPFLAMIGVFSFYLAFSGYRVLYRKRPERGQRATMLDWTGAALVLAASAGLVAWALWSRASGGSDLWIVALVFGVVGLGLAARDVHDFRRPPAERNAWWYRHMGNMLGAYIATLSAFSVVNFTFLPPVARWLWPTVLGTPVIAVWIRYYRRKFAAQRGGVAAAAGVADVA